MKLLDCFVQERDDDDNVDGPVEDVDEQKWSNHSSVEGNVEGTTAETSRNNQFNAVRQCR